MSKSTSSKDQEPSKIELLPFHPIADKLPLMEGKEFDELVGDIQRRGLRFPIVTFEGRIIDGRNRARACERAGVESRYVEFDGNAEDVLRFVVSANIHRRHLNPEARRDLIKELLLADPTKSDREHARTAKVSHHTVAAVRAEQEATGQIAQLKKRTGKDGKVREVPAKPTTEPGLNAVGKPYSASFDPNYRMTHRTPSIETRSPADGPMPMTADQENWVQKHKAAERRQKAADKKHHRNDAWYVARQEALGENSRRDYEEIADYLVETLPREWAERMIHQTCRLLTCGLQSGRTSAPIYPHRAQTIRPQSDRTGMSSAKRSPSSVAL
jgi:DNA-binding ferritin-like protein (Dps family)